jgi:hypothetical protein
METMPADMSRDLLRLWRHEARSFIDYIAGGSCPVAVDDQDRAVMEVLQRFHAAEQVIQLRVLEMLRNAGLRPDSPGWPLGAPTYNFMRPAALARVFCELVKKDQEALQLIRTRHGSGDSLNERLLRYVVDDALKLRESTVADLGKLLGFGSDAAPAPVVAVAAAPSTAAEAAAPTGPAWHDEALSLEERMALAEGKGLFEKLFAAMAQTDCTACGYDCEGYAKAIAEGSDKDISKCAPGGDETKVMLKKLVAK